MKSDAAKLLVWDFNGTLGYRDGHWRGAIHDLLTAEAPEFLPLSAQLPAFLRASFPWRHADRPHLHLDTAEKWWAALEPVFERTFRALGVDPLRADRFARRVRHYYCAAHRWHLYADVLPAIKALSAQGWQHALLTNHVPDLPQILRGLGIADRFVHIGNSAATGYEKPHPRAFELLSEAVGRVSEIWMIGDSPTSDYAGAQRAGWHALLVRQEGLATTAPSIPTLDDLVIYLGTAPRPPHTLHDALALSSI
jgi:putative hydrolase of the HAD superfamily